MGRTLLFLLALGLFAVVGCDAEVEPERTPPTVDSSEVGYHNAHLVDPASRTIRKGALVVSDDGMIAAVLSSLPETFTGRRVDLEGSWVIPGLVDMHMHSFGNVGPTQSTTQLLGPEAVSRVALYSGVTAVLDLFSAEDMILGFRDRQAAGDQREPGAELFAAGPCLTASEGHCTQYRLPTRIVDTPAEAAREVDELAAKRPDVVKVVYDHRSYGGKSMPTIDRQTLDAVVKAAVRHDLKTIVHIGTWDDVRDAVLAGASAVTHLPSGAPPPAGLPELMARQGTAHIPTLAVHGDSARLLDNPKNLDSAMLRAVTTKTLLDAYRQSTERTELLVEWLDEQKTVAARNLHDVGALSAAGVVMMTGTDAGNFGVFHGFSVHRELALLVAAGLTEWDALRAATTHPATFLGQNWGLQAGNEATFVVLSASPIQNIHNSGSIRLVVQRGRVVDRQALRIR